MAEVAATDDASARAAHVPVKPVRRPLDLIPVGLKEAALDSPTFRATTIHFSDQAELIEKWLEAYVRSAAKLVADVGALEGVVNNLIAASVPPPQIGEAIIDHDYTLLAVRKSAESARDFWQSLLRGSKRYEQTVIDPIRNVLGNEFRAFRESRRVLDATQRSFDSVVTRYAAQSKSKEASSLREDAFQLHEARKAYLRASMDYCIAAPQLRSTLDKLLVRVFSDQWKEMRVNREASTTLLATHTAEMERIRGWSRELENSERAFKRELLTARQQIEESALATTKPSREMDDYAASTVPYIGATLPDAKAPGDGSGKQGWLFMRTITGKPARTVWVRRWLFVKNGIFGWLVQGARSGGVEESEKIGVLLCGVRPWFQEERRFCFEVKTKDTSIILQAETQPDLTDWLSAFERAKRKALENPSSSELSMATTVLDPAFAVSPPVAPELAAKTGEGHSMEESNSSLTVADSGASGTPVRASFDVNPSRRIVSVDKDPEGARDHAARLMSKLDLHKRGSPSASQGQFGLPSSGIASLITASHNILPVGPGAPMLHATDVSRNSLQMPTTTLAPSTLANSPAATNLSHTAVVLSGERSLKLGHIHGSGTPSGLLANTWGSKYWGFVSHVNDDVKVDRARSSSQPETVPNHASSTVQSELKSTNGTGPSASTGDGTESSAIETPVARHRKTHSVPVDEIVAATRNEPGEGLPSNYPLPLKAQQAQFRMLFPNAPADETLVLVFRATWNPNEQQEFPGRVYVTSRKVYFFSNHLGLVLITGIALSAIEEITAAPGRDCDFLFLHLREDPRFDEGSRRMTVKVFLEPLRLLQRRLNYLVRNAAADDPDNVENILKTLFKMETSEGKRTSSADSWEDLTYEANRIDHLHDAPGETGRLRSERDLKSPLRIDGTVYGDLARTGREIQKFRLPSHAVTFVPQNMQTSVTRDYTVSAKALFHVVFGDKSAVFQLLFANRDVGAVEQGPWAREGNEIHWKRRFSSMGSATPHVEAQTIDIMNDHLCYVISNVKDPWRLPFASRFKLMTKFVITHTAKSRSRLAVYQRIDWHGPPPLGYLRNLVEKQALASLDADALDLSNVAMDQVAKLGSHSKTIRAVEIFGSIGKTSVVPRIDVNSIPALSGAVMTMSSKIHKPVSLPRLIADDVLYRILAWIGWCLDVLMAVCKSALNLCSAHRMLVLLLLTSACYNTWHTYRDGVTWYRERRASDFMARLGVRPDPSVSKAVYLKDIEHIIEAPSLESLVNGTVEWNDETTPGRTCRSTFHDEIFHSDPILLAAAAPPVAARLHRTRESLARYRHDLLVALRVVNRVERDVVAGEWQSWVRNEDRKCTRVRMMLQRADGNSNSPAEHTSLNTSELHRVERYCESCRFELEQLKEGDSTRLI